MDQRQRAELQDRLKLTIFTAEEFRRQGDEEEYEHWMARARALEQFIGAAEASDSAEVLH